MLKTVLPATLLLAGSLSTFAQQDAEVNRIVDKIMKIDTHTHVDVPMERKDMPGQHVDLRSAMKKAGLDGICMTFAVDYVPLKTKGQPEWRFYNALEGQDSILKWSNMHLVLNGKQLQEAIESGEPFAIQSVEGGHFLEGDVSRIKQAYDKGLRVFCLLHDNDANPPLGDVYTNEPKYGGLTQLGADAIAECNRLGILVDLAHCDSVTVRMALQKSTQPMIISHTGLNTRLGSNEFMGKMMYKRLISPSLAKEFAAAGGLLGVWPHLAQSAHEYAENIKAMVDLVGIDHVTIGTDEKITPAVNEITPGMAEEFKKREANRAQQHKEQDGKGEKRPGNGFRQKDPNAVNHVWNDDPMAFYPSVVRELLNVGFTENEIAKIAGGNFVKLFEKVVR
jgi:microsomal dipeptidase-like Zn-dependent dipeptidase